MDSTVSVSSLLLLQMRAIGLAMDRCLRVEGLHSRFATAHISLLRDRLLRGQGSGDLRQVLDHSGDVVDDRTARGSGCEQVVIARLEPAVTAHRSDGALRYRQKLRSFCLLDPLMGGIHLGGSDEPLCSQHVTNQTAVVFEPMPSIIGGKCTRLDFGVKLINDGRDPLDISGSGQLAIPAA